MKFVCELDSYINQVEFKPVLLKARLIARLGAKSVTQPSNLSHLSVSTLKSQPLKSYSLNIKSAS